jgi:hypothetical protein
VYRDLVDREASLSFPFETTLAVLFRATSSNL